jgi:hypothetical protein
MLFQQSCDVPEISVVIYAVMGANRVPLSPAMPWLRLSVAGISVLSIFSWIRMDAYGAHFQRSHGHQ